MRTISMLILTGILLLNSMCTEFPRDSNHSFEQAKTDSLQVGVVINPPFTQYKNKRFSGTEIELIRKFAAKNQLAVAFHKGNESNLVEKLQTYHIHIVTGGFDQETIWNKKTGISTAYDQKHVFLIPQGENRLLYELEEYLFERE